MVERTKELGEERCGPEEGGAEATEIRRVPVRERKREVGGSGGTGGRWWREDDMGKSNDG
jgi:hypothetical protein